MIQSILKFLLLGAGLGLSVDSQASTQQLLDSGYSIDVPEGFTQLTPEEIKVKFPTASPPQMVFGDERRTVTIAFGQRTANLTEEQLPQIKELMETSLERVRAGIKWHKREYVEQAGYRWAFIDFEANAIDTEIRNQMMIGVNAGNLITFGFNSTVEKFAESEETLLRARQSIAYTGTASAADGDVP